MYGRVAFALALAAGAASAEPLPREAAWLAPDADVVRALTETPGECLAPPVDADAEYAVEIGRAAFRNPLLLGGQAARSGLSCSSCHVDGRDNPDFFIEGLSGEPGTADVTSSLFSAVRDDGTFNPVPIPTLVGADGKNSFGTAAPQSSLHGFIAAAVADEFQGATPPDGLIDGVALYIAYLKPAACPEGPAPRTLARDMADARRALAAAGAAVGRGDAAIADVLFLAAQQELARIDERLAGDASAEAALADLAREIGALRGAAGAPVADALAPLMKSFIALEAELQAKEAQSLYDPAVLARAAGAGPAKD